MAQCTGSPPGTMEQIEDVLLQGRNAPASAEVYRRMKLRFRKLGAALFPPDPSHVLLNVSLDDMRNLTPLSTFWLSLQGKSDEAILKELKQALYWLNDFIIGHGRIMQKEQFMRMFRSAIEKEMAGVTNKWTDMEKLYMMLTDPTRSNLLQNLHSTGLLVLELKLAEQLSHVNQLVKQRSLCVQNAKKLNDDADTIRALMASRTQNGGIGHFACAIPLASLRHRPDIMDDNEGCCPICQNSYTDISSNLVQHLLADYPVRIKYCGHIMGKSCLERWMNIPKIDEAKYPHRTCPMCRVKIEGVKSPPYPDSLKKHVKTNGRAMQTLREFAYGWDMEPDDCLDLIVTSMSDEIAYEEFLVLFQNTPGMNQINREKDIKDVKDKIHAVKLERQLWGLGGDRIWRQMRDEWAASGVVRDE
ncbi:hypothetical protein ACEQ8H_004614 [Pleosporales sp. CAS-2024a]